jgi:hypothetical protein
MGRIEKNETCTLNNSLTLYRYYNDDGTTGGWVRCEENVVNSYLGEEVYILSEEARVINSSIYSKSIIQNDTVIEGCGIGRINVTEESTGIRLINVTLIEALFANCENVSIVESGFKEEGIRFVDVKSFLANNCDFLSNGAIKNCKNVVLVDCEIRTELDNINTFIAVESESDKEGLCTFSEEWNKVIVKNDGYD